MDKNERVGMTRQDFVVLICQKGNPLAISSHMRKEEDSTGQACRAH